MAIIIVKDFIQDIIINYMNSLNRVNTLKNYIQSSYRRVNHKNWVCCKKTRINYIIEEIIMVD
jgi:hypothetical protein